MVLTKTALFITIVVYVLLGNDVNAETIYAALAIYDQLRPTMTLLFSYGISSVSEVHISMCRIQKFLGYQELPKEDPNTNTQTLCKLPRISMECVNAKWNYDSSDNTLNDINLYIDKPQLVAIIGQVGSGKSSLFNVILRELPLCKGFLNVDGRISYACQETWLFSASIRQNILFGEPYQEDRYKTILKICALEPDLEILPYGDKTIVGEKGKILSGGQKARINLARCIYKDANIYLLDDPLSAVDIKVGKQLYEECIKKFLYNKICLLITHQLQYLKSADKIVILKEGSIIGEGNYDELQSSGLDFAKLLKEFNSEENENIKKIQSRQNSEMEQTEDDEDDPEEIKETIKKGSISPRLYLEYLRSGGNYFLILLVTSIFVGTFSISSFGEYFISEWVNLEEKVIKDNNSNQTHSNTAVDREIMIYEYCAIMLGTIILAILQSTSFFIFLMSASVNIHDSIFAKISYATMQFFNTNHTGRILNRFSKDMGVIDELLPYIIYDVMQILLYFLSAVVLTSIVNPMLLLPASGFLVIFYLLRNVYLETSRTVKRIEGITRSPIYSHMTASVQGLSTIRASLAQNTLAKEFDDHQDLHSSAWFLYIASNKAFAFYLEGLCAIIVLSVVLSLILTDREYYGGQAGLILTQYINIVNVLQWGMSGWSSLENNMTSVERVFEYKNVKTEPIRKELSVLPRGWPEFGKIVFQNVSMRYNPEDKAVLKDLDFTINSKEKVGVVGRTGAGKSSMIAALFQLYEIEGTTIIDGVDTTEVPLEELRKSISIIPQDPVLFSGTIRRNLDPFDEYNDDILWNALEQVELKQIISELPKNLFGNVAENGSNFSIGQRQLICLARAIVRNNKILVMDEATANVDAHTDNLIQKTIREKFAGCTVITIAHRLHTIMDSDKVLVIDDGKVMEFNHPYSLLQNRNSIFYAMVEATGTSAAMNLHNIAENNFKKR
ncbi:hypothetical protein ILUMI_11262 [Ignelater luminosus]|uniref:Multidrug resistance-associated protein lethal(2)03659 n=1 Tax=Ignelater luminosus TaxID=2038154 RepID=A0A8K0GE42_IGNLU|nr:hypothetical protein ILUMI_11262 [Ignelater luminosus]